MGGKKCVLLYLQWCHKRGRTVFRPDCRSNLRLFRMWKHTYKNSNLWDNDCLVPNSGLLDLYLKVPGSKLNRETAKSYWRFTFSLCYSRNMLLHSFVETTTDSFHMLFNLLFINNPTDIICNIHKYLETDICLFSWRYNPFGCIFHSPIAGFSLLIRGF